MNEKTAPVDVLAVMDGAAAVLDTPTPCETAKLLRQARAAVEELIEKAERFGLLFERRDNDMLPDDIGPATEAEVVEAMYAMRAALARVVGGA